MVKPVIDSEREKADKKSLAQAQRAFRRVAIKVRAEYRRHGMKPLVWSDKP